MLGDHPLITNAKLSELTFLTPIIHTQTCAYQGARNVKFFGKLHVLLNGRSLYILRHYCSHHIATIQLVEIFQMHIEDTVKKSVLTRFSTCKFSFKQEYRSYIIPKHIEVVFNAMHWSKVFNPLTTNASHRIETSQLICRVNQLTGFYMIGDIGRSWVNIGFEKVVILLVTWFTYKFLHFQNYVIYFSI